MSQMRRWARLLVGILLLAMVGSAFLPGGTAAPVSAGMGTQPGVRLVASNDQGVTLEVSVPWQTLSLEPVTAEAGDYVRVSLPGWASTGRAGAPELPFWSAAIGVPFGVELAVRVQPGPAHTLALTAPLLPVATQRGDWGLLPPGEGAPAVPETALVIEPDAAIYGTGGDYPGALSRVTADGVVRGQRVAGIAAYPVQYESAAGQVTVYESLRVEVRFEGKPTTGGVADDSPAYEEVLRSSLLNYEIARGWRLAGREGTGFQGDPWAPPEPGWRVKVREEGFYKLTYAELLDAGVPVDTGLPTSTFQLFNLGGEVAIEVRDEDEDGVFDPEDSLLFYGQAVASKYTADNVYWLTYGQGPGLRMGSRDGTPGEAATPDFYAALRPMEANAYYRQSAPGDDDLERWFWDYVYPPSKPSWSHTFPLPAPYAGAYDGATLTVVLLGSLSHTIDPDHHVKISLNGTEVADEWWDGITWKTVQVPVGQELLQAGNNTLTVVCPNDTGVGVDYVYVDRAGLVFANTFLAEADELPFGYEASGTWKFQVDGFGAADVAVYDVTDPAEVVRIEGAGVSGSGPYSALFEDTLAAPTDYWALASTAARAVVAIEEDTPSDLGSTANGADHLTITHQEFAVQAAELRDFRASQGWRAMWVDVQDVYDEYGYGIVGAAPIHDFLAFAYDNWQAPAPSFVVLVGDGHYDPKDYAGYGRVSFLPPYLAFADPWSGETAADNRYVTLVGWDTLPDMMLGRLAVNSSAQAGAFVDKIVAYEQSPVQGEWQRQVLAVADNADDGGNFPAMSDSLLWCCLPEPYQAERVYYLVTHPTVAEARAAILGGINAGKLVVNYIGHASNSSWASEGLLKNADVAGLTNGGKLPVLLPMTCVEGYYIYPQVASNYEALAEVVTRAAGKGAVASWSPTGAGVTTGHDDLDKGFFRAVFQDGLVRLGEATAAAKLALWHTGLNYDLLDTYLLFGDPLTEMALPEEEPSPALTLTKRTNGQDADSPPGPYVPVGNAVTWDYQVTNTGNVELTDVVVSDDQLGEVCTIPSLAAGESQTCSLTGEAAEGQYANVGSATGTPPGGLPDVSDTDPSHYFGLILGIGLEKRTNGEDADEPPGPTIPAGAPVAWTYGVTNTGNVDLTGVQVTDDQGVQVTCPTTLLSPGESMECTGEGIASEGQYHNIGTVSGTSQGWNVWAQDQSYYYGGPVERWIYLPLIVHGY